MPPSPGPNVPLPSTSTWRPPDGNVTVVASASVTVNVPSGPPPFPGPFTAIVATPSEASFAANRTGGPVLSSVLPWPTIARGQPPAGLGPDGR